MIGIMLPLSHYLMDVYRVSGLAPIERFLLRIKSTCLFFLLLTGWHYTAGTGPQPMIAVLPTFVLVLTLPLISETVIRNVLIRLDLWGLPAVVIGAGAIGQRVVRVLKQMPELGLRPVGVFEDGDKRPSQVQDVPVLGSIADSAALQPAHRNRDRHQFDHGDTRDRRHRERSRLSQSHRGAGPARAADALGEGARLQTV